MNELTQTENNSPKLDNDMENNQEASYSKKNYDERKSWAIVKFESDIEDDLEGFID